MSAKKKQSVAAQDGPPVYWGAPLHEWGTAVGLGILIYWRPWQDGMVIPASNNAYLLGALLLFVLWAARSLVRGTMNIPMIPCALLFGFLVVTWLSGLASIQYQATQVAFTIWCGYAMVFILASSLRSGTAIGFVLAFVAVTSAAEALFSIIHLKYSLPETRAFVFNNPQSAAGLFGHELNPALIHRLNSNRAFGTLLFANALATWLVATLPLSLFGAWYTIRKLQSGGDSTKTVTPLVRGMGIGVVAAVASAPILSSASTITTLVNIAFSNVTIGIPFSQAMMRVPVAAIVVVVFQLFSIGIAFAIFAVLRMLLRPGKERNGDSTAHAMIAGVTTAGILCISLAVLYTYFHYFFFAESIMVNERMTIIRNPIHQPIIPFLLCVLVVPVAGAGIAIRVTRQRGPETFIWLAASVVLTIAAIAQAIALGMTYSRGGIMALVAGVGIALFVFRPTKAAPNTIAKIISATAGILILVSTTFLVIGGEAHAQDPVGSTPINPHVAEIEVDGTDITIGDLVNPTTVSLRFSYWAGAFKMAADHWLTGVGLGNFGLAYPPYQPLGGGDSKQVHNDYLQLLCETGLVGLVFFVGFWGWFVFEGWRRLRVTAPADGGWWLAGIYACVIGFLVHAIVDFPFEDPSLAMLVFLLAGLFWAKASGGENRSEMAPGRARAITTVCLLFAVTVIGMSARIDHVNAAVGTKDVRQARISFTSQFLRGIEAPKNSPPSVLDSTFALLVEDPSMRSAFGMHIYQPNPADPSYAQLPPGSPIPRDARLMVTNMPLAVAKAREASANWTTRIAEADAVFPYDPDIAFHISLWFDMLWRNGDSPTEGLAYIKEAVVWAERAVERNPWQVAYYDWLLGMRWRRALSEPELEDQLAYFELSLEAIDRTVELYPIKYNLWDRHALIYLYASQKFEERGQPERAEECLVIMKQSQDQSAIIRDFHAAQAKKKES